MADGSPKGADVSKIIKKYQDKDSRILYKKLVQNGGTSDNTNAAIAMTSGDYIVLADHDDAMTEDALFECAKAVKEHPECEVIYSDEDKMDMDGGALFDPHFKPDFNLEQYAKTDGLITKLGDLGRNLTEPRTMILFSDAQRLLLEYGIFLRYCIIGAVIRIPQPAILRASCMHLRPVLELLWSITIE